MVSSPESRFNRFHVYTTYYKTIHRSHGSRRANPSCKPPAYLQDKEPHKIAVHILIPRTLLPGPSPLLVKFHGGGLSGGDANYPPWWAHWLVPFVCRNNAIAVIPDYRLMPEHDGKEIMEDVADFWEWVGGKAARGRRRVLGSIQEGNGETNGASGKSEDCSWEEGGLQEEVKRLNWEVEIDWDRVCIDGDSAGGLLALQSVILGSVKKSPSLAPSPPILHFYPPDLIPILRRPHRAHNEPHINIRALILHYPMTTHLSRKPNRFGPNDMPIPTDDSLIDKHIASIAPGTIVSRSTPWKRFPLSYTLAAFNRWLDYYGDDPSLLPIDAIDRFASKPDAWRQSMPPILFLHGEKDTAVDVRDTERFCDKMGQLLGKQWIKENVRLEIRGGDHGFDLNLGEEDNKWLRNAVKWVEDRWIGE